MSSNGRKKHGARTLLERYLGGLVTVVMAISLHRLIDLGLLPFKPFKAELPSLSMLLAGPVEEFAKFLVFWVLTRSLASLKEPLDGVLQAAAVALAFSSVENLLFGFHHQSALVVLQRLLVATTGHLTYAAVWGLFLTCRRFGLLKGSARRQRRALLLAVLGAAALHTLYNLLLELGLLLFALAVDGLTVLASVLILRSLSGQSLYGASPLTEPRRESGEQAQRFFLYHFFAYADSRA